MDIKDQILADIEELNNFNRKNNELRDKIIYKLSTAVDKIDFEKLPNENDKKITALTGIITALTSSLNEKEDIKLKAIKMKSKVVSEDDDVVSGKEIVAFIKSIHENKINKNGEKLGTSTDETLFEERGKMEGLSISTDETTLETDKLKENLLNELDEE